MNDNAIEQEIQAKGLTAPRITPADLEQAIVGCYIFTAAQAVGDSAPIMDPLKLLTICVLVLRNGFTVTGESACASPENFDAELGGKIARANAVAKMWPLLSYELKGRLHVIANARPPLTEADAAADLAGTPRPNRQSPT